MNRQSEQTSNRWSVFNGVAILAMALAVIALTSGPVMAQAGVDKDTKKLQEKVEKARESLEEAVEQVKGTMGLYNTLFEPEVDKPESIYKKFEKGIEECDKAAEQARKTVDDMRKDLQEFYAGWEKEIAAFSSESMKERGQESLDRVRGRYERFDTALNGASELYGPFIATLRDHALFLGRDLSPEALGALGEETETLNQTATELYAKIDEALNDTRAGEAEDMEPAGGADPTGDEEPAGGMEESE
jgi:chromosome segregation ATPase